jgi:transcriptional regulator with XRE-family HTH domain
MIGQRVAAARKLREMTGRDLADRAHVSYSLLTKVETGHAPASADFVAACARALRVDPRELTGEPYRGETPASDRADAAVAGIRAVLLGDDLLDPDAPRRSLASLQPALATAGGLRNVARYVQLAEVLPGLLRELLAATATTPAGQTYTRHLGYLDLAALAVERMAAAAEQSGDPLWRAVAAEKRAHLQVAQGQTGSHYRPDRLVPFGRRRRHPPQRRQQVMPGASARGRQFQDHRSRPRYPLPPRARQPRQAVEERRHLHRLQTPAGTAARSPPDPPASARHSPYVMATYPEHERTMRERMLVKFNAERMPERVWTIRAETVNRIPGVWSEENALQIDSMGCVEWEITDLIPRLYYLICWDWPDDARKPLFEDDYREVLA